MSSRRKIISCQRLSPRAALEFARLHEDIPTPFRGRPVDFQERVQRTAQELCLFQAGRLLLLIQDREQKGYLGWIWLEPVDAEEARIKSLWVREEFRRQGFARFLKQEAERQAHQMGYRKLSTRVDSRNVAVLELNRSLGYREAAPSEVRAPATKSPADPARIRCMVKGLI